MVDESVSNTRVYVKVSIYGLSLVRVIVLVIFGRSAVFHGGSAVFQGGSAVFQGRSTVFCCGTAFGL